MVLFRASLPEDDHNFSNIYDKSAENPLLVGRQSVFLNKLTLEDFEKIDLPL